jgi:hypothetical protein
MAPDASELLRLSTQINLSVEKVTHSLIVKLYTNDSNILFDDYKFGYKK